MKSLSVLSAVILFLISGNITSQDLQICNVSDRKQLSLNGKWNYIIDPYETGYYDNKYKPFDTYQKPPSKAFFTDSKAESKDDLVEYSFDRTPTLKVPGDWNSQDDKLLYYEGTIWYRRLFNHIESGEEKRYFVYFGAVNYEADVYLNKQKVGRHTGGFTPFYFEITDIVRSGQNSLIVKVDNRRRAEGVPTLNTDWWNYGGITRDVSIVEVPSTFIEDYSIGLNPKGENITGNITLNGSKCNDIITVSIPELKIKKSLSADDKGFASFDLMAKDIKRWSPDDPHLYTVIIESGLDTVTERIGFRTVRTRGHEILLNDKPIFLRGISIHEENPFRGSRANGPEDARLLLEWARQLNCNYVRLAHYPHNEYMVRLADEMGILVWEENPVYWTIQWQNEETLDNARNQLKEMITRDKNRASVIIWSMANETPVIPERLAFIRSLIDYTRSLDETRLISAALEKHQKKGSDNIQVVEDPLSEYVDIIGVNEYIG
ncbi:MAG: beta-glucuronidase, partial [Bacteroidales bacterium]|nr:beta-glucuronidase [Bacteroidales bacterium]